MVAQVIRGGRLVLLARGLPFAGGHDYESVRKRLPMAARWPVEASRAIGLPRWYSDKPVSHGSAESRCRRLAGIACEASWFIPCLVDIGQPPNSRRPLAGQIVSECFISQDVLPVLLLFTSFAA